MSNKVGSIVINGIKKTNHIDLRFSDPTCILRVYRGFVHTLEKLGVFFDVDVLYGGYRDVNDKTEIYLIIVKRDRYV